MSLVLNVEILGEFRKLTQATTGATSTLQNMNARVSKFSSFMKSSLATIGVGFSLGLVVRELKQAGQAAVEDAKSAGLLELALKNVTKATDRQVTAVEKSITKMSLQAAVADDKIRPAFANLVRATGDVQKSTDLMRLSLDVAAGTGKDVEAVSKAIAKAVGPDGTTGALERLVPAIKGASDPMRVLGEMFDGAAAKAANLDPYQQMKIAFDEISEAVGLIMLPVLKDFAKFIVDIVPKVQDFFKELTNPTTEMGAKWAGMWEMIGLVGQQFDGLMKIFSGGKGGFSMVMDWVTSLAAGLGQIMFYLGRLAQGFQAMQKGNWGKVADLASSYISDYNAFVRSQNLALSGVGAKNTATGAGYMNNTININLSGSNVTAQDIVNKLNKYYKNNGRVNLGML